MRNHKKVVLFDFQQFFLLLTFSNLSITNLYFVYNYPLPAPVEDLRDVSRHNNSAPTGALTYRISFFIPFLQQLPQRPRLIPHPGFHAAHIDGTETFFVEVAGVLFT